MKKLIFLACFTWISLSISFFPSTVLGREKSKDIQIHLIQIKGMKKNLNGKKSKVDPILQKKKYKKIMKNLLSNYFYQWYKLVDEKKQKVSWNETIHFTLHNKMILKVTPQNKKKKSKWIYLKIQIQSLVIQKKSKKPSKKKYTKVLDMVQKLKNQATFILRLKMDKGVLFIALKASSKK